MGFPSRIAAVILSLCLLTSTLQAEETPAGPLLDANQLLAAESFWDNRDFAWYRQHIPLLECPDPDIQTTYYYRWEVVTKHLTYGSPNSGYSFTEFIDRPFWSGAYGAISCPAGHQLYEVRWLRDPRFARDYSRYWLRTPGAHPRRYSTWLADSVWAAHQVHPDEAFIKDLLADLVKNHQGWERERFVPEIGLFWQIGHDDGMETNINSRQTKDWFRGAPGYRPTLNSYLYADALAIARIARLAGDEPLARQYDVQAASLKKLVQEKLWDAEREFFLHVYRQDEEKDGHRIRALSKTHETGQFAGSRHGRELMGYVPWQFNLPDRGYEQAWKFLNDPNYFAAEYGPTTTERHDPLFLISKHCCVWSGQSWPYATTQTLVALANLLNNYEQDVVTPQDYFEVLTAYTRTHRKDGRPYIAEAAHPDTGSWEGHDAYNHSEHYFHSAYNDLIITGLIGLRPQDGDETIVNPLAPPAWKYFALDQVPYRGHLLTIAWDADGSRYGLGRGLHVLVDGKKAATRETLGKLTFTLPAKEPPKPAATTPVNFAVNNDGHYYPRITASHTSRETPLMKLIDGNYWYHISPPNRWTCTGSTADQDWVQIDFGTPRTIHTVKLYVLDDGQDIVPPETMLVEYLAESDGNWQAIPRAAWQPERPAGRMANVLSFDPLEVRKLRVTLVHRSGAKSGLSEIEAWGDAELPVEPAPPPSGNLAKGAKVTASFTSRFDKPEEIVDGQANFQPEPRNRWTSYESPNAEDWLEIDLGQTKQIARAELALYDDRGGVQAPKSYRVETFDGRAWQPVRDAVTTPDAPAGGAWNEVRFMPVTAQKLRLVFVHRDKSRSGVTEVLVWGE